MANNPSSTVSNTGKRRDFWVLLACLTVILSVLFHKSFLPEYVLHNNDTPLGAVATQANSLPEGFTGSWVDSNWPGGALLTMVPDLSTLFRWFFGTFAFAKFWTPLSQLFLGLSAWVLFRSLKLSPVACVIGGLAAGLHGDAFSNACWGQQSRPLALGWMMLAMAATQEQKGLRGWLRMLLAGAAVGLGIMEGYDFAALFSVVLGIYVLVQPWFSEESVTVGKITRSIARAVVVAGFSGMVAAFTVTSLIGTQIKGVSVIEDQTKTKAERWAWATQWSFPKSETLSVLVPGLLGYRMDTPNGGQYWGIAGRDLSWDAYYDSGMKGPPGHGFLRYGGAGCYAGPIILTLALWAFLQSLRKKDSPFTPGQKRFIWCWTGTAVVCVLLAWGRFAPFYQFFYALPHADAIRNPGKFMHIFGWASLVLCAMGVHALSKKYWETRQPATSASQNWWLTAPGFDRKWVVGSVMAVGLTLLGWLIYASSDDQLKQYLMDVQFDPATAAEIARFSISRLGWFLISLTAGLGVLAFIITGRLAGARARLGAILLGAVLVADLAHANLPWIVNWNWKQKYASNELLDKLKVKAYEQRVVGLPDFILSAFQFPEEITGAERYLDQLYRIEWAQHHFLFENIQSLDVIQLPRPPQDYVAYETALAVRSGDTLPLLTRKWELTNTRYILALAPFADFLNRQFDPGKERYRVADRFDLTTKPGIVRPSKLEDLTAVLNTNGKYALIEFTGALPRAQLYTDWQVSTNDAATLKQLADRSFDPHQTVLVADPIAAPATPATNAIAAAAEITSYRNKHITLKTKADAPGVLLYNDRYVAPYWAARVDGKPAPILRCNYLMRGVQVPAGEHTVEFVFQADMSMMKLTVASLILSALIGLALVFLRKPAGTA